MYTEIDASKVMSFFYEAFDDQLQGNQEGKEE